MGINVKVQKSPKPIEIITVEARLVRELKSCMRCRYFHGNNRQCIAKKCVKELLFGGLKLFLLLLALVVRVLLSLVGIAAHD